MLLRPTLFMTGMLLAVPLFAAPAPTGCAARQAAIEGKLEAARAQGNANKVAGLQTALEESRAHCTDAGLVQERTQRVLDAEKEVAQREKDLRKAMNTGDAEKLEKRRSKLAEARTELDQAKRELSGETAP
ncbi:hypothetical protein D3C76_686140 [compost metagenome]